MNKIYLFLYISVMIWATSCSSTKDIDRDKMKFQGYSEIEKGDTAKISWKIPNSDHVIIEELNSEFDSEDSTFVAPEENKSYTFNVIKGIDTTHYKWNVQVKSNDPNDIKTGPDSDFKGEWLPSYTESKYLIGRLGKSVDVKPKAMKVMQIDNMIKEKGELEIKFSLIDEFGNFIPDYFNKYKNSILVNTQCGNDLLKYSSFSINENHNKNENLNINLNIENSFASGEYDNIEKLLEKFINAISPEDKVKLNYFNQNSEEIINYSEPDKAIEELHLHNIPLPTGLNGVYKNTYKEIKTLPAGNNMFVIICYSPDNSSLIYNANDLVKTALERKVPVYVVSLGYAVNTYNLKYITDRTGGRFYNIASNETDKLESILKEIYYSHKSYYSVKLLISQSDVNNCSEIKSYSYIENTDDLNDKFKILSREKAQYTDYQSIASFDYKQTIISDSFTPNVKDLADVLKQNPDMAVELIGHSSIEGDDEYNTQISIKRAQEVRKLLLFYGAKSDQIRLRGEGSSLPVYYLQQKPWQQYYNRRVELKWLDPSLLPFEIIDEVFNTETQALERVEEWERKGMMAYYDRYLINNNPKYRVKIWGYPTLKDAQESAEKLAQEYKRNFIVQ